MQILTISLSRLTFSLLILIGAVTASANADERVCQQGLCLAHLELPPMPPASMMGVMYLHLQNIGSQQIVIQSISTPVARKSMLHETVTEDGTSRMRHLQTLAIAAGETVRLERKGKHLMLMGIEQNQLAKIRQSGEVSLEVKLASGQTINYVVSLPKR